MKIKGVSKIDTKDILKGYNKMIELLKDEINGIKKANKITIGRKLKDANHMTYKILKILHPSITILDERTIGKRYYRVILLNDKEDSKVLACSETYIDRISKKLKEDIITKKGALGVSLSKNSFVGKRVIYSFLKGNLKEKGNIKRKKGVQLGRSYVILNKEKKVVFNIIEFLL